MFTTLEILIMSAIFLVVVVLAFLILRWTWKPDERMEERLANEQSDYMPGVEAETRVGPLNSILSKLLPITDDARIHLYRDLRNAGYYSPTAIYEYLARRNFYVILLLLAGAGLLALVPEYILYIAFGTMLAAMLAFTVPRLLVNLTARKRMQQIERGLPVVIDLVNLGLSSGLNIPAALDRVSYEVRHSYPVWADELQIVHRQAQLRSVEYALGEFGDRVPVPEARQFAQILSQSERMGSDASTVLSETADNLRVTMRQRAEAQANRASFWMLMPTISCFMVATALMLIGPVLLELNNKAGEFRTMMRDGFDNIKKTNVPNR